MKSRHNRQLKIENSSTATLTTLSEADSGSFASVPSPPTKYNSQTSNVPLVGDFQPLEPQQQQDIDIVKEFKYISEEHKSCSSSFGDNLESRDTSYKASNRTENKDKLKMKLESYLLVCINFFPYSFFTDRQSFETCARYIFTSYFILYSHTHITY